MGKIEQTINTAGLRTGNTIATPFRIVGEGGNALANVLRQGQSSAKNTAEVGKQTIDALVDNFLNFSKVEGKRYQRLTKGTINLASALTRRPAMIAGAGVLSGLNQGVIQPFKKLLYTPGKMFKGMRNATRIFSKKKGFDFASYDTHETGKDTRIQKIHDKRFGFLGAKTGSSENIKEEKKEVKTEKKEDKKVETNPVEKKEEKQAEVKSEEKTSPEKTKKSPHKESDVFQKKIQEGDDAFIDKELKERGYPRGGKLKNSDIEEKPKTLEALHKKHKNESEKKDQIEQSKKEWKNLGRKEKSKNASEYEKLFDNTMTEEGVLARAKKNNLGDNIDQILITLKKENPTMAGYIEEEILAKKAPLSNVA